MIHITLKDGSVKEFEAGVSVIDVAKSLGAGLTKAACCGRINGEVADLRTPHHRGLPAGNLHLRRRGRQKNLLAHLLPCDGAGGQTPVSAGQICHRSGH